MLNRLQDRLQQLQEKSRRRRRYLTSLRMAGSPEEEQQHDADDEQRADGDGCQRGEGAALLGVLFFPCKQTQENITVKMILNQDGFRDVTAG